MLRQRHQRNDVAAFLKFAVAAAARCTRSFRPRCCSGSPPCCCGSSTSLTGIFVPESESCCGSLLDKLDVSEPMVKTLRRPWCLLLWQRLDGSQSFRPPSCVCKDRCRPSRTFRRLLSFLSYRSSIKTMCLPSPLFYRGLVGFSHGSFNADITRASDLMIVGESVRSLLFVIMLTLLVTGRFSRLVLREFRLCDCDQQILGCKPRSFPAALALGACLLLRLDCVRKNEAMATQLQQRNTPAFP